MDIWDNKYDSFGNGNQLKDIAKMEYKYSPLDITHNSQSLKQIPNQYDSYSNHPIVNKYLQQSINTDNNLLSRNFTKTSPNESNLFCSESNTYINQTLDTNQGHYQNEPYSHRTINKNKNFNFDYEIKKNEYKKKMNNIQYPRHKRELSNEVPFNNTLISTNTEYPNNQNYTRITHAKEVSNRYDNTYLHMPSIKKHTKNKYSMNSSYSRRY